MRRFFDNVLSQNLYVYLFLFFAAFTLYGVTLHGPFFFDDNIFIERNASVQSFDIHAIYTSSTTLGSGISGDNFYRPNEQLIYAVLIKVFGAAPWVFHFVSVCFHSFNAYLVFLLFLILGLRRPYAFLGALLFLFHPVQTQAVSYISGLSEPVVTTCVLGALILFLRGMKENFTPKRTIGILTLTVAGFFSKENALILPALICICGIYLYKKQNVGISRKAIWIWVTVVSFSLIYLSLRLTVFNFTSGLTGGFGIVTFQNVYTQSLYVRMITFTSTLWQYAVLLLVPMSLHYETPYTAYTTFASITGVFGLIVIYGGLALAYQSLIKGKGVFFLAFAWFFLSILPVSGIIPTNAMYLEHWLYMPIIGIIFGFLYFVEKNPNFLHVPVIALCIYLPLTIYRNLDWADPIRFYRNEIRYTPSARIFANLGLELANRGDCGDAIPYYEQAIYMSDQYPQTHHNLGKCLEDSGDIANAIVEYKKALEIDPNFIYSLSRLELLLGK